MLLKQSTSNEKIEIKVKSWLLNATLFYAFAHILKTLKLTNQSKNMSRIVQERRLVKQLFSGIGKCKNVH